MQAGKSPKKQNARPSQAAPVSSNTPAERQKQAPVRHGRHSRSSLTVHRQSLVPQAHSSDEDIVRIRTGVDRVMLALILILLALGSIMVFSASYPSALAERHDSLYYIKRQILFILLGVCAMTALSILPPGFYKRVAVPAFLVGCFLLIVVLIPGIGISNGEARRWLGIKGTPFTFQPSELMKFALVMILAWYIDTFHDAVTDTLDRRRRFLYGTLIPCCFVGVACGLVLLEKHLSGTVIIGLIGVFVMFIGGVQPLWMFGIAGTGGLAAISAFLALNPYALERLTTFTDENADTLKEAWQTTQGLLAIGSGGLLGVGLGGSRQKYSYVSEAQNDFIFTIWCEEMGFVGALCVIALYLLFIWRGYVIAMRAPDTFSSLLVFGIISQVGIQAFLNIAVVTDVLPNTGISLPFFSYGGTSLIILLAEMGVVLSISKHSYQRRT